MSNLAKKKVRTKILEEVKEALETEFNNRIVTINYGNIANEWVSSHSSMEVSVAVKRLNIDIINTMYDVVYKIMFKNNFNYLISLRIKDWKGNNKNKVHKTIKGKLISEIVMHKEENIWKAV